jgi:hypothetical protein
MYSLESPLSQIDLQALDANFQTYCKDRVPSLAIDKAFERYCCENILKDYGLSDEEITSGNCGSTDDGGVDGLYFFVGRQLITIDTPVPIGATTATLAIIQATTSTGGFSETRIDKFDSFARDLLDYHTPPATITHLTQKARDLIANFRDKYASVISTPHTLEVVFHYAGKTNITPDRNPKIGSRFKKIDKHVKSQLTDARVSLELWNATRILKRVREQPEQRLLIDVSLHFQTRNKDVVCLARLVDFYRFLKGKDGHLRAEILEPNVRDYQGDRNPVNNDIRQTLETPQTSEFWWLNNGITLLAKDSSVSGGKLSIDSPEIVNGLQTSFQIFQFYSDNQSRLNDESRSILLRVICPPDERTGSLITKATNFQTVVAGISLHATEETHFNIEDRLSLHGLYYDRKKGKYKRLNKPVPLIVSVLEMARSVIAILLRKPGDARARPQTLLQKDEPYVEIFNRDYDVDLYVACILLDRKVAAFLDSFTNARPEERRDIRFYVDMWLGCELSRTPTPTAGSIAKTIKAVNDLSGPAIEAASRSVLRIYRRLGGDENVAKGARFTVSIQKAINRKLRKSVK